MTVYIKAPLGPGGIVEVRGKMERLEGRANATEVVYGDATFLQEQAYKGWPDLDWQIEKVSENKYIIKGDAKHQASSL
jgi:hypothetical protein